MRHRDWQARLLEQLQAYAERPFVWGQYDCCLFAADCASAICGTDPAAAYRGSYDSELGARKALLRNHKTMAAAFGACFAEVNPGMVQRGDIVLFDGPLGQTAGIWWAGQIWAMGEVGLVQWQSRPVRAWRVE